MARALIIVDVQLDFCEGGSLAVVGGNAAAARIRELVESGRYETVAATRDFHRDPGDHFAAEPDYVDSWPAHCVIGTAGAELHPDVAALTAAGTVNAVFDKGEFAAAYSGFEGSSSGVTLGEWLVEREVTAVDIVGIATDFCVKATALDAADAGLDTTVLLDHTAAVSEATLAAAIDELASAGVTLTGGV